MHWLRMRRWLFAGAFLGAIWGTAAVAEEKVKPRERIGIRVGGGLEGQVMTLAERLATGPMWEAALSVAPFRWMAAEVMYSGSTHEVDSSQPFVGDTGATSGADFVRNGGQVAAIFNAPTPVVQPYALVGIGFDDHNWRGDPSILYRDDTSGRIPLGAGLKTGLGPFAADLRFNYNVLFSQDYARLSEADEIGATFDLGLQLGARF